MPHHPIPASAWAFAAACLAGQVLLLLDRGAKPLAGDTLISMLIGVVVVTWFAAGVLRARTVRMVVVAVLLGLAVLLDLISLLDTGRSGLDLVHLLVAIAQVAALAVFAGTDYYRWQRTRPAGRGPEITGLLLVAALAGALGGLAVSDPSTGVSFQIQV